MVTVGRGRHGTHEFWAPWLGWKSVSSTTGGKLVLKEVSYAYTCVEAHQIERSNRLRLWTRHQESWNTWWNGCVWRVCQDGLRQGSYHSRQL
jgi:hypothetical protein